MSYLYHNNETHNLDIHGLCLKTLIDFSKKPKNILDLGAHHGQGVKKLFDQLNNVEKYMMVEPAPKCIKIIENMLLELKNDKLSLVSGVINKTEGEITFFDMPNTDESSNLFGARVGYGTPEEISVKMHPFQSLGHFDFVKCNIEGHEYKLIEDGFFDQVDSFLIEIHQRHVKKTNDEYYTITDAINVLKDKFDLVSHGQLQHKYCFLAGVKV